jgi:hypothetical protein
MDALQGGKQAEAPIITHTPPHFPSSRTMMMMMMMMMILLLVACLQKKNSV